MNLENDDLEAQILLERSAEGDQYSFDKLVGLLKLRLHATALRITHDHAQADEAVAMALMRLYMAKDQFRSASRVSTWAHTIVTHCAIDLKRRSGQKLDGISLPLLSLDSEFYVNDASEKQEEYQHEIQTKYTSRRIMAAMNRLPRSSRSTLEAFHCEGRSYEEIAFDCRIPLGTVKSRLARARRLLRDRLPPLSQIEEESIYNMAA